MLRVIGDIHGNYVFYRGIIRNVEQSFQVGDMGFDYYPIFTIDSFNHKFIGGNHEDYRYVHNIPSYLGAYGIWRSNIGDIFYMRGAWSIDTAQRNKYEEMTGQKVHFKEEELHPDKLEEALQFYIDKKPDFVITHSCPQGIQKEFVKPDSFAMKFGHTSGNISTSTGEILQRMYEAHKPKLWIFGHYHIFKELVDDNTHFVCLNMCPFDHWYVDVEKTDDGWKVILPIKE